MISKSAVKEILGEIPLTAELYWHLRRTGKPVEPGLNLGRLGQHLPGWASQASAAAQDAPPGRRVAVFATLRYWIEHACLLGLTLAGLGHQVSLGYFPYAGWKTPVNHFDLRRQNRYASQILAAADPPMPAVSLLEAARGPQPLPPDLVEAMAGLAVRDTQYSLQIEAIDRQSELYRLRLGRNQGAARAAQAWLGDWRPDVVLIPNGSILEFGALYHTARHLGFDVVTYEFGEQRQRIWLAQNDDVMRQDTGPMWEARRDRRLEPDELARLRELFAARQSADLWANFARRWQGTPSAGAAAARAALGLDSRPVALLATNVIGDSLTLGRQTFSRDMSEWIVRTVSHFVERPDAHLVIRIHPGEQIMSGPSVAALIQEAWPRLPGHVHLILADAEVNTYDLVDMADLGLVYTTTVGMEMAMRGLPVIVVGQTHYRGKGFSLDPESWEAYWEVLDRVLSNPAAERLSEAQVESAWAYAYRFFFEYPRPFPWRLLNLWDEVQEWPLDRVVSPEGQACFGTTFRNLVGEPLDWEAVS